MVTDGLNRHSDEKKAFVSMSLHRIQIPHATPNITDAQDVVSSLYSNKTYQKVTVDKTVYDHINQIEETHWWYMARRRIIFDWVERILATYKDPRVLDIGCGTGFNIAYLHQLGYGQIAGLDFSPDALAYCHSRKLKVLICGDAERLPIQQHCYDTVLTLDIIEHLKDDRSALSEIFRVLKPGGSLIIFVPAFQFLWSFQDEIGHHQRRYTAKELKEKVLQAGFELRKLTYVNSLLFPVVWLGRIVLRAFPKYFKITSESQMNPSWMNDFLYRIFRAELPLLHFMNFPFGVSILCVCKKPVEQLPDPAHHPINNN